MISGDGALILARAEAAINTALVMLSEDLRFDLDKDVNCRILQAAVGYLQFLLGTFATPSQQTRTVDRLAAEAELMKSLGLRDAMTAELDPPCS